MAWSADDGDTVLLPPCPLGVSRRGLVGSRWISPFDDLDL